MEQVGYVVPGAVASYSAKSALFSAAETDRGTFFDCTGSFTITLTTSGMSAGWSAWFRNVSGTQVLDPSGATLINGSATYSIANAGDVVLVEYTGSAYVVSHAQRPSTVAITGGTIDGTAIGGTSKAAGAFTTVSATGVITSTLVTGTAPFTVASTTVVANLNVSQLLGATWAAPGTIGSGTPSTGAFTTISASGAITSTLATGTAPFTVASTTVVANLNASLLLGLTWGAPGLIGSVTPATGAFTTLTASGDSTVTSATDSTTTGTGCLVLTGGLGIAKAVFIGTTLNVAGTTTAVALTLTGAIGSTRAAATNGAINVKVSGDAANRAGFLAGGDITWGDGTASFDLSIHRNAAGVLEVNNTTAGSWRDIKVRDVIATSGTLAKTTTAYTNGAGALTGTLLNSPVTGNPTKWAPVDDNGTTRYVPMW